MGTCSADLPLHPRPFRYDGSPADGCNATANFTAAYAFYVEAAKRLGKLPDAGICATPADVPPVVIVPGLTSASINYRLDDSPPPKDAFWCERTTAGWLPLWPVDTTYFELHIPKFVCWVANIQVKFDPETQAFSSLRANEQTELVDFGGFEGIGPLAVIAPFLELAGWTIGEDLFAAPFDWRVPSAGQAEFFAYYREDEVACVLGQIAVLLDAFAQPDAPP